MILYHFSKILLFRDKQPQTKTILGLGSHRYFFYRMFTDDIATTNCMKGIHSWIILSAKLVCNILFVFLISNIRTYSGLAMEFLCFLNLSNAIFQFEKPSVIKAFSLLEETTIFTYLITSILDQLNLIHSSPR